MKQRQNNQSLTRWMDSALAGVVDELCASYDSGFHVHTEDGLDLTGRNTIYSVLDDLLAILFPGAFSTERIDRHTLDFFLHDKLRHACFRLSRQIDSVLRYRCEQENCENCNCEERAEEALHEMVEALPRIRAVLLLDVQAAYDGDPAAKSLDEIVLSYPCIEAIATHRLAHVLYRLDVPVIPRIMAERAHCRTGIDIHPGAQIGPQFFIDHGTGVVIGETATIGSNVKLYQGVTLGALSFPLDDKGRPVKGVKRHPDIEDDVVVYANATILGGATRIGKGAVIGGNTWITRSVPAGTKVYSHSEQASGGNGECAEEAHGPLC